MSQRELLELLEKSRAYNQAKNITGVLLFKPGSFIQILEGKEKCLKSLYARIRADPRHHRVITISEGEVPKREFQEWAMGYRDITGADLPIVPGFTTYMSSPNETEGSLNQSIRYGELLEMFKGTIRV